MKKFILIPIICTICQIHVLAQHVGVKSNLLYDLTTTINLGMEVGLAPKWTLEVPVNYNPWNLGTDKKFKHWLVQPEVRYWFCERFNGHFLGLHGHIGEYNVGGIKLIGLEKYRYEGNLYGGGLSYGYQYIINKRWSIEATIGIGYTYLDHSKFLCERCAAKLYDDTKHWFGPTKAGVSLIYILR